MATFAPPDPDFERRTREMFAAHAFLGLLGARLTELTPGRSAVELPFRPELAQHTGVFHGGILATLADIAGGAAGNTLLPAGSAAVTVEFKINLIAPAQGDLLVARGQVVRAGKSITVARSEVFAVTGGAETACATCLMTSMAVPR